HLHQFLLMELNKSKQERKNNRTSYKTYGIERILDFNLVTRFLITSILSKIRSIPYVLFKRSCCSFVPASICLIPSAEIDVNDVFFIISCISLIAAAIDTASSM